MVSMTREQFIAYAHEVTSPEALESLYERIAEHNNEVAMFGDSGPGRLRSLHESISEVKKIEATLARLEKREPRNFYFAPRSPN